MTERTQDEIRDRLRAVSADDHLGWRFEVLIEYLDFEHADEFIQNSITLKDWLQITAAERGAGTLGAATRYLEFAFGKAYDQRGISASRSVVKLGEYAWLLGRDELAARMADADEYHSYGLPLLIAFANEFGLPVPSEAP